MIKLNFGCGPFHLDGWTNVDYQNKWEPAPDLHFNVQNPEYPWEKNSVDFIYASHLLSLFWESDILDILRQWHSILKPGGVLRIVEPNFEWFLDQYFKKSETGKVVFESSVLKTKRDLDDVRRSGKQFYTPAHQFQWDYNRWGHKFLFDSETLEAFLRKGVGFSGVKHCAINLSPHKGLNNIDRQRSSGGELFVEAVK